MPIVVGEVVEGTVSSIKHFGAFIQLPSGETGLCHISEVANDYVDDVKKYLKENQKVKVKVIEVGEKGRISLSIKKAQQLSKTCKPIEVDWQKKPLNENISFEDKLSKFLKDSEEKNKTNKKSSTRRSNGYLNKREIAR